MVFQLAYAKEFNYLHVEGKPHVMRSAFVIHNKKNDYVIYYLSILTFLQSIFFICICTHPSDSKSIKCVLYFSQILLVILELLSCFMEFQFREGSEEVSKQTNGKQMIQTKKNIQPEYVY